MFSFHWVVTACLHTTNIMSSQDISIPENIITVAKENYGRWFGTLCNITNLTKKSRKAFILKVWGAVVEVRETHLQTRRRFQRWGWCCGATCRTHWRRCRGLPWRAGWHWGWERCWRLVRHLDGDEGRMGGGGGRNKEKNSVSTPWSATSTLCTGSLHHHLSSCSGLLLYVARPRPQCPGTPPTNLLYSNRNTKLHKNIFTLWNRQL